MHFVEAVALTKKLPEQKAGTEGVELATPRAGIIDLVSMSMMIPPVSCVLHLPPVAERLQEALGLPTWQSPRP